MLLIKLSCSQIVEAIVSNKSHSLIKTSFELNIQPCGIFLSSSQKLIFHPVGRVWPSTQSNFHTHVEANFHLIYLHYDDLFIHPSEISLYSSLKLNNYPADSSQPYKFSSSEVFTTEFSINSIQFGVSMEIEESLAVNILHGIAREACCSE